MSHSISTGDGSRASPVIAFAGGGTAGHVFPGLAVAARLGRRIVWIGSSRGVEKQLVTDAGIEFHGIPAGKLRRYLSLRNITDVIRTAAGVVASLGILGRVKPALLFSKGGFVSVPPVLAAWMRGHSRLDARVGFRPRAGHAHQHAFLREGARLFPRDRGRPARRVPGKGGRDRQPGPRRAVRRRPAARQGLRRCRRRHPAAPGDRGQPGLVVRELARACKPAAAPAAFLRRPPGGGKGHFPRGASGLLPRGIFPRRASRPPVRGGPRDQQGGGEHAGRDRRAGQAVPPHPAAGEQQPWRPAEKRREVQHPRRLRGPLGRRGDARGIRHGGRRPVRIAPETGGNGAVRLHARRREGRTRPSRT